MQWALDEIRKIQTAARSGKPIMKPRWPVLIMRTPKGWSGPKKVAGEFVEGSFHAHQVPLMAVKSDADQLADLQKWLLSYGPVSTHAHGGFLFGVKWVEEIRRCQDLVECVSHSKHI